MQQPDFLCGTLTGNNDLAVGGTLTWSGGTFGGTGAASVAGATNFTGAGVLSTRSLTLNGGGIFSNNVGMIMQSNATITVPTGQTLTVQASNPSITWSGSGNLVNQGTIVKNGAGTVTFNAQTVNNSGTIKGISSIVFSSTFNHTGVVAPGLSVGLLTLNKLSNASAALQIEIAGTGGAGASNGHDRLTVSGLPAALGGSLDIQLLGGFVPNFGQSFAILNLPSGYTNTAFTSVTTTPALPYNAGWKIDYLATSVVLNYCQKWFQDADADGYGNLAVAQINCTQPSGYVADSTDCNDGNAAVHPGATEVCNGIDDDCDGQTDEGCSTPLSVNAGDCQVVYYGYAPLSCTTLHAVATGGTPPYSYAWSNGMTGANIQVCPTASQTYTVTVTGTGGATATDGVTVEVVDVRCGNNNNKVLLCHNGSNTLCVSANAVAAHLAHGDQLGSCGTQPCSSANKGTSGTSHISASKARISCYPNPTSTDLHVPIEGEVPEQGFLEIADFMGKIVRRNDAQLSPSKLMRIDLNGLPPGTYLLRWSAEGKVLAVKTFVFVQE